MKQIRTELDDEYDKMLQEIADKMFDINQRAVEEGQDDIKGISSYLLEIIEIIMENRDVLGGE